MSATGRPGSSTRTSNDFYATPSWLVHRLLEAAPHLLRYKSYLAPSAGDGAIIRAFNEMRFRQARPPAEWTAIDIRPEPQAALEALAPGRAFAGVDFLAQELEDGDADAVIENPPFDLAFDFIQKIVGKVDYAAFLLRLSFLASAERNSFLNGTYVEDDADEEQQALPVDGRVPDIYVLPDRPTFKRVWALSKKTGKFAMTTSDSADYCWAVWPRSPREVGSVHILRCTPEDVRKAARELTPVEDADGNVLWAPGRVCGVCGGATRWSAQEKDHAWVCCVTEPKHREHLVEVVR
jgi:hypothetical protein